MRYRHKSAYQHFEQHNAFRKLSPQPPRDTAENSTVNYSAWEQ